LSAVRVMIDVPELPASIWAGTGPAAIVKSVTWKVTVTETGANVPLVPVTTTA
jgi:hypothetical protein